MGGQMTEEELQRWRQALRKAEDEELAAIEPERSERDAAIADFVVARAPHKVPRFSRRAMLGTSLLLAASLAVVVLPRLGSDEPLPEYAQLVRGDERQMAPSPAPADGPVHVRGDSLLHVELRPATAVKGEVETRVYVKQGAEVSPSAGRFERSGPGVLRLKLPVRELPERREGMLTLLFVIGRPGKLPSLEAVKRALSAGASRGDHWLLLQSQILVEQ
jgi:hypothetical protein